MAVNRRTAKEEPLNLIPIMNLVSILIPFLLMAAEFVQLAVIDSTLPAIGPPQPMTEEEKPDKPPLQLSLGITAKGILVLGADHVLYPDGGAPTVAEGEQRPPTVPCKSNSTCTGLDDYNWEEVTRLLAKIKKEYPDDQNVILVPDSRIQYEIIVATMDASRQDKENLNEEGKAQDLFPYVVIAGGAM